jgi:hemoglobin
MANAEDPEPAATQDDDAVPTLLEWAGGPAAIVGLINAFYDRLEREPMLNPLFPGGVGADHRDHVARWWIEVFGGADDYTTELGGYENMLAHHRNLAITADQRRRFASLMGRAADDAGLPEDPEFRAAFVGYVERGTRLAMSNSQVDSEPVPHAPVPRWGWGVAPPYEP